MKKILKKVLLFLILLFCNISFGQEKCIKILEVNEIKYYYVYKVLGFPEKDTITMLSSKSDPEFEIIKLDKNKFYKVKTRLRSAIKITEEKHIICKIAINVVDNIPISDKYNLPVLVLNFKEVEYCEKCR